MMLLTSHFCSSIVICLGYAFTFSTRSWSYEGYKSWLCSLAFLRSILYWNFDNEHAIIKDRATSGLIIDGFNVFLFSFHTSRIFFPLVGVEFAASFTNFAVSSFPIFLNAYEVVSLSSLKLDELYISWHFRRFERALLSSNVLVGRPRPTDSELFLSVKLISLYTDAGKLIIKQSHSRFSFWNLSFFRLLLFHFIKYL